MLTLAAALMVFLPVQAAGQLLGGLLDKPLSNLLGALPGGTTRVIVRTERGALAPVLRLVLTLGGRLVAQHKLIDALTIELPVVQLALVVRLPGVLSVTLDSPVASQPIVDIGPAESHLAETLGLPDGGLLGTAPDGRGIVVGVIDSGLSANGAYQVRRFVDFTGRPTASPTPRTPSRPTTTATARTSAA